MPPLLFYCTHINYLKLNYCIALCDKWAPFHWSVTSNSTSILFVTDISSLEFDAVKRKIWEVHSIFCKSQIFLLLFLQVKNWHKLFFSYFSHAQLRGFPQTAWLGLWHCFNCHGTTFSSQWIDGLIVNKFWVVSYLCQCF